MKVILLVSFLLFLFLTLVILGLALFFEDRQNKRKAELKKAKLEAKWERASKAFRDDMTQEGFEEIVAGVERLIKRVESLKVKGHKVYGTVSALSGISSWKFVITFDCGGHLTSEYSISSDNDDSNIPERIAKHIAEGIRTWSPSTGRVAAAFCPYCGTKAGQGTAFCPSCGARLPQVPERP